MDPQNFSPNCILGRDLKVLLRQSFDSLLQVSIAACSSLLPLYLFLQHIYSFVTKFLYRDRSFFGSLTLCPVRSVVQSILCCDNLMCVYWNSYVATLTIMLRHCFCSASLILCRNPVFMSRQYFCWFLLQQCFLYCQHSYRDQKGLSRQSLVSTEPDFLLQLHFDVAT